MTDRKDALAAALRANLKRRKAAAPQKPTSPGAPPPVAPVPPRSGEGD